MNTFKIIDEYTKWYLQWDWQLYLHCTIQWAKVSCFLIVKYWCRLIKKIDESLYGKRGRRKKMGVNYVIAIEEESEGYHIHIHGLIGGVGTQFLCRRCIIKFWEYFIGKLSGLARCEKFNKELAKNGVFYLCKHQIKKGNIRDFFKREKDEIKMQMIVIKRLGKDNKIHLLLGDKPACVIGDIIYQKRKQMTLF